MGTISTVRPKKVDLAWAAGILDGEGYVSIRRGTGRNLAFLQVGVNITSPEVVKRLRQVFQRGCVSRTTKTKAGKRVHKWAVVSQDAAAVLRLVLPYLVILEKRRQAQVGLEFQAQKRPGPGTIRDRGTSRLIAYKARQERYRLRMKALHRLPPTRS